MWQAFVFMLLIILAIAYQGGYLSARKLYFQCGAEKRVPFGRDQAFMNNHRYYKGGKLQDSTLAHTGRYAMRLSPETHLFGFDFKVDLKGNELVKVEVWKHGNGQNAAAGKAVLTVNDAGFWHSAEQVVETVDGWERIYQEFNIPEHLAGKQLNFSCWNSGNTPIWMDDMKVEIIRK